MSKEGEPIKQATVKELNDEIFRVVGINNHTAEKYELLQKTHSEWVASLDKLRKHHAVEMDDCLTENLALREENIRLKKRLRAIRRAFDTTFEIELPRPAEVQGDPPAQIQDGVSGFQLHRLANALPISRFAVLRRL